MEGDIGGGNCTVMHFVLKYIMGLHLRGNGGGPLGSNHGK